MTGPRVATATPGEASPGSLTITELVERSWRIAHDKGFHDTGESVATWIALAHSELSEALEELREGRLDMTFRKDDGKPEGLVVEMADAIIRIADTCGSLELDLEGAILAKMAYNATRPYRHGKRF